MHEVSNAFPKFILVGCVHLAEETHQIF